MLVKNINDNIHHKSNLFLLAEHRNKKMTGKYGVDAFKCNALIVDSKFLLPSKE